jgi:hypothetical protein
LRRSVAEKKDALRVQAKIAELTTNAFYKKEFSTLSQLTPELVKIIDTALL